MKYLQIILLLSLLLTSAAKGQEDSKIEEYRKSCKADLDYLQKILKEDSAIYANNADKAFKDWYEEGYKKTLKLIDLIGDQDDCYYAMKYYVNGFGSSHMTLRGYMLLPQEQYPGLLSAGNDFGHYIIYKNTDLAYLNEIEIGDQLTHINDIEISEYYQSYLLPFYANDESDLTKKSASVYALIVDGNRFKPIPRKITLKRGETIIDLDLKYMELIGGGLSAAKKVKQPEYGEEFKVEMVSNGVWIKIPSFFPTREEAIYFKGMLSTLRYELAKEDYILFDVRGNRGGSSQWSRPILRNLWGDEAIQSLGKNHIYNKDWEKKLRVSKGNYIDFKSTLSEAFAKQYLNALKKGDKFILKKWSIYQDKDNLYTNIEEITENEKGEKKTRQPMQTKIYVLTDSFCRSTCWDFVREIKQMPGVVHLGHDTTIQSIYSYATQKRSPSEHFDFFFPTQVRIKPSYNLGESLSPTIAYEGDLKDESKVIDWILSITEKD